MPETRERIIGQMAEAVAYPSSIGGVSVTIVDNRMRDEAAKMLPVAVKAVTDRVREELPNPHPLDITQERWRHCVCFLCVDYRDNLAMLDQIDTEMGCQP